MCEDPSCLAGQVSLQFCKPRVKRSVVTAGGPSDSRPLPEQGKAGGYESEYRIQEVLLELACFAASAMCANCPVQLWCAPLSMKSYIVLILVSERLSPTPSSSYGLESWVGSLVYGFFM